jgi:RNA polymerase sigma-70 factor (ECF subfamily)
MADEPGLTASSASLETCEAELHALLRAGDIELAIERTIRAYGPELIAWLSSMFANEADAFDAFSWMSEELCRSFKRFDGRCSIRTWCYMLARHAAFHVRSQPRKRREVLLSHVPSVLGAVSHAWNTTRRQDQHARSVYAEIRRQLDEDDQALLVLRVDRDLAWRDIAIVFLGEAADGDAVTRKAAMLRKQFERVKERLRALAALRLRNGTRAAHSDRH